MNREDIIRMAQEAGLDPDLWNYTDAFERFATLVASAERERIKQANAPEIERINAHIKELEDAVLAEREACAKVCDEYDNGRHANAADLCATAIRARDQEGDVGIIRYADISVGKIIHNSSPPQRTWAGLTEGEVDKMILLMGFPPDWITENAIVKNIVRNLEAKLKEKNT